MSNIHPLEFLGNLRLRPRLPIPQNINFLCHDISNRFRTVLFSSELHANGGPLPTWHKAWRAERALPAKMKMEKEQCRIKSMMFSSFILIYLVFLCGMAGIYVFLFALIHFSGEFFRPERRGGISNTYVVRSIVCLLQACIMDQRMSCLLLQHPNSNIFVYGCVVYLLQVFMHRG